MPTYYVDGAVGNNENLGTSEGAGNAWATISYAVSQVSAGDQVWVKGGTDYTETTARPVGLSSAWITFSGYTTTPGDGGKATIDATGETYGISAIGPPISVYARWENIIIENATSYGASCGNDGYDAWINCEFNNNGGGGVLGNKTTFVGCSATGNTGIGISTGYGSVVNCVSSGNSTDGVKSNAVFGCELISNAGIAIQGTNFCPAFCCNTIDGDNDDTTIGIQTISYQNSIMINNIIYDCATGISVATNSSGHEVSNNLLYANATNFTNIPAEHDNLTTDAPAFTDEAGGDYTLASGSAARNAGADASGTSSPGMDIGAHQSADAGGGGSRVIITG